MRHWTSVYQTDCEIGLINFKLRHLVPIEGYEWKMTATNMKREQVDNIWILHYDSFKGVLLTNICMKPHCLCHTYLGYIQNYCSNTSKLPTAFTLSQHDQ